MINNYKEFMKFISNLSFKPKLLLHACCAPCSSHVLLFLKNYFDITIYFSNDNIYPSSEYFHRLDEINIFANHFDIKVISDEYNPNNYYDAIKGLEELGEKSHRCYECYKLRLENTCKKAKELNYDYFTTTLSISPHKLANWINEIGYNLEEKYNVKYLYSDFKKDNGYQNSIKISKEYNLYRQDYCGCVFSYKERNGNNDSFKEEN